MPQVCKKSRSVREDERLLRMVILPRWGGERISSVTRAEITALHYSLAPTPVQANRTLALLSKMFNLAEVWELKPDGSNPCRHIRKYPEKKRERYLSTRNSSNWRCFSRGRGGRHRISPGDPRRSFDSAHRRPSWRSAHLALGRREHSAESLTLPDSKTGRKEIVLAAPTIHLLEALHET